MNTTDSQLSTRTETALSEPSIPQMLQAVVAGGVTEANVAVIEKMLAIHERMKAKESEQAFISSFHALQGDIPVIVATSIIPNRGKYERFEDVMRVVGPLLIRHGFSVSFSNSSHENRITETCTLSHISGHSRQNSFTVRVGGKADSETQADCKAATTAKRNALLNALNIVIRQDAYQDEEDNAMIEGGIITQAEADELRCRVMSSGANELKFLEFAGAVAFEEIKSSMLPQCREVLARREAKQK